MIDLSKPMDRQWVGGHDFVPMKLNLGAGSHPLGPPWINIDRSKSVQPSMSLGPLYATVDLTEGIPAPDNSCDQITCHHFLEHLTYEQAGDLLKDCYRVLQPGGRMTIVVPDFAYLVREFRNDAISLEYWANLMLFCEGPDGDKHRSAWSRELLVTWAEEAGFQVDETEDDVNMFPNLVAQVDWQTGIAVMKPVI